MQKVTKLSEVMKNSLVVRLYIYFYVIVWLVILFGGTYYFAPLINSIWNISISMSYLLIFFVILIFLIGATLSFMFNRRYVLFRHFIEGDKNGIKINMGILVVILIISGIMYKSFIDNDGLWSFIALIIFIIISWIFHIFRYLEVK